MSIQGGIGLSLDKEDDERVGMDNGRVQKLRKKMLVTPEICIERCSLITQSYKDTENYPHIIRRAKALKTVLNEMTIRIEDGELIVGWPTSKIRGAALTPEYRWEWYLKEIDNISTREWDRFLPLPKDKRAELEDLLPYWRGRSLYEKWLAMIPENDLKKNHKIGVGIAHCDCNQHHGHACVDYGQVLNQGLNGVKEQIDRELDKLNLVDVKDFEKYQFLTAASITLDAAVTFAKRYSKLASELAGKETDPQRKAELEKIAETCDWVPARPARSFYEALQSVWFTYVVVLVESWVGSMSFGRIDQYLFPFYKKDLEEGRITREEARELIGMLYIKMNGSVLVQSADQVTSFAGYPIWATVTLGGLTKDGKDAVNELSYLFLEAEENVRLNAEDIIIRIHKNTPDAFLIKACQVASLLNGKLKFLSDETIIQQLLHNGNPIDYARDYIVAGCNAPTIPGYSHDTPHGLFNLPMMLDLALNDGKSRLTGEQIGPKTGDARNFNSYDEIWNAYKKQVEALVPVAILYRNVDRQLFAEYAQAPFQSALYHGCIEKGLDITNGGTVPYTVAPIGLAGAPNVGDSLAAIRKAVFDDQRITMDRIINALDKNFSGEEEVLHILKSAPKFGNDEDYVDSIVNDVIVHGFTEMAKYNSYAGTASGANCAAITGNIPMGYIVGALPDGRKAGEPLSEGGISPYQGRNISGPTATMRSVAKLDHVKARGSLILNMRFNPIVLKDEEKMRKFALLIRTYCETGGSLVQFNIVSTDTLKEAQNHPQKYRDLLVRVATYSAYFVELPAEMQNDIIARMEFQEV